MHVMIDLETLSLRPDAHVLEVAAVPFDAEGVRVVDAFQAFCGEQRRHIDFETLAWWLSDDPERGAGIIARQRVAAGLVEARPLREVLIGLRAWLGRLEKVEGIWCRGASFDLAILRHAYMTEPDAVPVPAAAPWSHRVERCSRTALAFYPWRDESSWHYEYQAEQALGTRFVKHAALHDAAAEAFRVSGLLPPSKE